MSERDMLMCLCSKHFWEGVWAVLASGGSCRMAVELGKTRMCVCAARDTGSLAVKVKAGTVFQEPLTEIAILHWNGKSST